MYHSAPGFLAVVGFGSFFPPLSLHSTGKHRKTENEATGEGRGGERSQTIRQRESLVLYNTLNTLWFDPLTLLARERGESATSQLVNSPHLARSRSRTELTLYLREGENYSDYVQKEEKKNRKSSKLKQIVH
jgi:hypothetical protein